MVKCSNQPTSNHPERDNQYLPQITNFWGDGCYRIVGKICMVPSGHWWWWLSEHGWQSCAFSDGRSQPCNDNPMVFILLIIIIRIITVIIIHRLVEPVFANNISKIILKFEILEIDVLGCNNVPDKMEWIFVDVVSFV